MNQEKYYAKIDMNKTGLRSNNCQGPHPNMV